MTAQRKSPHEIVIVTNCAPGELTRFSGVSSFWRRLWWATQFPHPLSARDRPRNRPPDPHQRQQGTAQLSTYRAAPSRAAGAEHSQPRRQTYGEESKEGSEEDRAEESQGRQVSAEGPRKMNYTLTQSFHRTQTLSGELKAAESALTDCEADANAKARIASIAAEAVDKAKAHLEALRQEREELADHMAALVRKTGEKLELPEPESPFWRGDVEGADFHSQALQNGLDRIGETLDASRT